MFHVQRQIAVSALLLASFTGAAFAAESAGIQRDGGETCARTVLAAESRVTGHPGRAAPARQRLVRTPADCPRQESRPMILASYTDAPGGVALVRGRAEQALGQIGARKRAQRPTLVLNNQCVAHTVLRQFSEARAACDAAVDAANAERDRAGRRFDSSNRMADSTVAVALSNRAVLNWLTHDVTAAHKDMARARVLAPTARFVTRNWLVAERAPSLARLPDDRAALG